MNKKKRKKMKKKYKKTIREIRSDINILEFLRSSCPVDEGFSDVESIILENLLKNLKKIFKKDERNENK